MATYAKPKNQSIKEVYWSVGGAVLLRSIVGQDSNIKGMRVYNGFISAETAREYGNKILDFLKKYPNHENFAWLKHKAKFFLECEGFWQS